MVQTNAVADISLYAEKGQLIRAPRAVTTLGVDLFGDKVNLYNGNLEFIQTDISLPGNNGLSVSVARRLATGKSVLAYGHFSQWELEIPHMHGIFALDKGWVSAIGAPSNTAEMNKRCSNFNAPPDASGSFGSTSSWDALEFWQGNFLYVPGVGDQEVLKRSPTNNNIPTDFTPSTSNYALVTRDLWTFRCANLANPGGTFGTQGEGFIAISPDGTQYLFDRLVKRSMTSLTKGTSAPIPLVNAGTGLPASTSDTLMEGDGSTVTPTIIATNTLSRTEVWLLPSKVTDRFGNTVTYNYDTVDQWRLNSIIASDNRQLIFTYYPNSHVISSVYDGSRTWNYTYSGQALDKVIQPDGATWQLAGIANLATYNIRPMSDAFSCDYPSALNLFDVSGTMVHPSGATGSFTLSPTRHGRSFVEKYCIVFDPMNNGELLRHDKLFDTYSLVNKTIGNLGMATMSWIYDYGDPHNATAYQGNTSFSSWSDCATSCGGTKTVKVTDPKGDFTRYTFGNRFQANEGQLQIVENVQVNPLNSAQTILRTTTSHYSNAFPEPVGTSDHDRGDQVLSSRHTPVDIRITTQQGVTFTWQANSFDTKARSNSITRFSSIGIPRTETTVYWDNLSKWILGQIDSVTESSTGAVMVKNTYDGIYSNLLTTSHFGHLDQTLSYNADGTLYKRKDGKNQIITYTNYKRGLAQNVLYPNGTSESAIVENIGVISATTNAATFTTNYGYDAMGRLNRITPPTGDDVSWNPTTILFEPVTTVEYELPAGHWRQTVSTGNARTITYLDGLWRPVLTRTFDAASPGTTSQAILNKYDHNGNAVYTSYPQRDISGVNASPVGTRSTYDALGRVTNTNADSELGPLNTDVVYNPGFTKKVINPRGQYTTTSYQAFDQPAENAPVTIVSPESLSVVINRDIFGKPTAINRNGAGVSATRSYQYDVNQRLCNSIEPETGATRQDYDLANNIVWRASGLAASTTCATTVAAASKINYAYDTLNRLINTNYADGSAGIVRSYTPDGLPATVSTNGVNPSVWTSIYNRRRLLKQETLTYGGINYPISWNYNANGHLSQMIYPDTKVINTLPNALGQASQLENYATGISYYPNGAIDSFTYGNGIVHKLTQNVRGLPWVSKDNGILQDTYSYDQNGNVASITDGTTNNTSRSMMYDNLDRLTNANAPGMWGVASYTYDVLDNIRTSNIGSRTNLHNYDATKNRLTSITSNFSTYNLSYNSYDSQGNITLRGSQAFIFDQGNRLKSATGKASYIYDGLGHRVQVDSADSSKLIQIYTPAGQLLYTKQSGGSTQTKEIKYIYLNRHVIAEVSK
ncbi:MAG: hypothetical protein Q7R66_14835 [Undibacterium sp.]|nr:hypothetical protein [Undibacterium sp.]